MPQKGVEMLDVIIERNEMGVHLPRWQAWVLGINRDISMVPCLLKRWCLLLLKSWGKGLLRNVVAEGRAGNCRGRSFLSGGQGRSRTDLSDGPTSGSKDISEKASAWHAIVDIPFPWTSGQEKCPCRWLMAEPCPSSMPDCPGAVRTKVWPKPHFNTGSLFLRVWFKGKAEKLRITTVNEHLSSPNEQTNTCVWLSPTVGDDSLLIGLNRIAL